MESNSKSVELREIYDEYRSKYCNKNMTSEQNEALRKLHESYSECQGITLSQIDNLFNDKSVSKFFPKSVTGRNFFDFK
jgi:hypothetical protein